MATRSPIGRDGENALDERAGSLLRLSEQAIRRSRWDSAVRVAGGEGTSATAGKTPAIPADLLSDRLDELERTVNQLEWNDRQLRRELLQSRHEQRKAEYARLRWKLAALLVLAWLVGSASLESWTPARPAHATGSLQAGNEDR